MGNSLPGKTPNTPMLGFLMIWVRWNKKHQALSYKDLIWYVNIC